MILRQGGFCHTLIDGLAYRGWNGLKAQLTKSLDQGCRDHRLRMLRADPEAEPVSATG